MGSEQSAPAAVEEIEVPVVAHVYDLGETSQMQTLNSALSAFGTGAFHCGVEIYGWEWSYRSSAHGSGIIGCHPKQSPCHSYRSTWEMGSVKLSKSQVRHILQDMRSEWQGSAYDLLNKNCCHFCDAFCERLGLGSLPMWTKSLAEVGASMKAMYDSAVSSFDLAWMSGSKSLPEREVITSEMKSTCSAKVEREATFQRMPRISRLALRQSPRASHNSNSGVYHPASGYSAGPLLLMMTSARSTPRRRH